MKKEQLVSQMEVLVNTMEFQTFKVGLETAFKTQEELGKWIYPQGLSLENYIYASSNTDSVVGVADQIERIFKEHNFGKVIKQMKATKLPARYIEQWLGYQGLDKQFISSFRKIKSGKRNIFAFFLLFIIKFTTPNS